jgi:hypothetical protein
MVNNRIHATRLAIGITGSSRAVYKRPRPTGIPFRHSELLQIYNNTEADTDRIWAIALEIWKGISSAMIARAFLLAYSIMGKIIETKSDTEWLKNGAPHCNVRRDYYDTERGVKKLTDVVNIVEDDTAPSQCY